jgi:hypothetical protein
MWKSEIELCAHLVDFFDVTHYGMPWQNYLNIYAEMAKGECGLIKAGCDYHIKAGKCYSWFREWHTF